MGILGRWTSAASPDPERANAIHSDPLGRALHEVREGTDSLAKFLRERRLIAVDHGKAFEHGRERVEKSGLLRIMQETCAAMNELAGRTVVDAHSFLAPEPVLGCFIFVKGGSEYVLRLELRGAMPFLVFAERKWRDHVANDFVRWAYRLVDVEPMSISVKVIHEVRDCQVSADEVRQWFFYLVSGFDRSYVPTFRQAVS